MNKHKLQATTAAVALALVSTAADAGPREQAMRIHERLAGVPPTETVLLNMATQIQAGNISNGPGSAAYIAMDNPAFYNVTLKNWATPWTNRDFDVFRSLNDYTATVIGLVRDEADFREVLTGDVVYRGTAATGVPAYAVDNNDHYEQLEADNVDLSQLANFERVAQSSLNGLPSQATAGVMTSRGGAKAFFYLGTNRAMFRFTLINHLCTDLEQLNDTSRAPDRIRQDVSRSPGGDSRVFLNNCLGCHSGMDPLAQAFAYYDYSFDPDNDPDAEFGQITYNDVGQTDPDTGTRVVRKYHINSATFPYGFVTPDDSWDNYWREGQNQSMGWAQTGAGSAGSGNGAKSMGEELANSQAFAYCQVEKVFEQVCLREPGDDNDRTEVDSIVASFTASDADPYNLKQVFADTADYCKGL